MYRIYPIGCEFLIPYFADHVRIVDDPEDASFILAMNSDDPHCASRMKGARRYEKIVAWWTIEDPNWFDKFLHQAALADVVFTSDEACIPAYFSKLGHKRVFWLPMACSPEYHRPLITHETATDFVLSGNWFDNEARRWSVSSVVDPLIDAGYGLTLFAYESRMWPARYQPYWKGRTHYMTVAEQYQMGKTVLGLTNQRSGLDGRGVTYMTSMRTFEALACQKPFLAAKSDAYERLGLENGKHMLWVDNPADATRAAQHLLSDEGSRIAARGREFVLAYHTYRRRLDKIAEIVAEVNQRRSSAPQASASQHWTCASQAELTERAKLGSSSVVESEPRDDGAPRTPNSEPRIFRRCNELNAPEPVTYARVAHLALPEFKAWDPERELPRMRQWEQPFALFQAPIEPNASILDCSITPAGFAERIRCLYRYVSYQHVTPIVEGSFAVPSGVPDDSFDRVFCINTLEHLTATQRWLLLRELARKVRKGGAIILVLDQYFEGYRDLPSFRAAGAMKEGFHEVFGGWNSVAPAEVAASLRSLRLFPLGPVPLALPDRNDGSLYLQDAPYEHTSFGVVSTPNGVPTKLSSRRRIVLALLTWNTKQVSLQSAATHFREAEMLQRLGHEPMVCICDNGSLDGTAEALRELDCSTDVPHQFIYNSCNLGNAIARNQIIDVALASNADYLLFMDGDIELIPFSSVAMLRYLDDEDHPVGCIGPDMHSCSSIPEQCASSMLSVEEASAVHGVAWTQYGLFRCDIFRDGVRFDVDPPFDGPGWGFEDNDLAFQMQMAGYVVRRFTNVRYCHRAPRSSIGIMQRSGIDARTLYERRRQRILEKWSSIAGINVAWIEEMVDLPL